MALIDCEECKNKVSSTAVKCPSCGFVINKPERGITGVIFQFIFILFNGLMILLLTFSLIEPIYYTDIVMEDSLKKALLVLIVWLIVDIPLAMMNYMTRPAAYE